MTISPTWTLRCSRYFATSSAVRIGNWRNVERSLPVAHSLLVDVMSGRCQVSVVVAFRVAKVLGASIYDVIVERAVPAGTCRSCGKEPSEHWRCEGEATDGA